MYAEIEVHRTMLCDRVRTEAFRRAIDRGCAPATSCSTSGRNLNPEPVRGEGRSCARQRAVERTTVAVLAQELAMANGVAEVVEVIHGDIVGIELPERVDVIVSEWLGGFGIDEGMLVPVIAARDRLKPAAP